MPQLKLVFEDGKPVNAVAKFIATFNSFYRDCAVPEVSEDRVLIHGKPYTKRELFEQKRKAYIERLCDIYRGTEFAEFGEDMLRGFVETLEKTKNISKVDSLKREYYVKGKTVSPSVKFIAAFNSFFRDYGKIETSDEKVIFRGEEMEKRDVYWIVFAETTEEIYLVCKGRDFELFGKAMLSGFTEAVQKQANRYRRKLKEKQRQIDRERRRREREERERNERGNTDGNTAG